MSIPLITTEGSRASMRASWSLLLVIGAAAACNAHINRFDVEPRHPCPGQEVEIVWDVTGSATLAFSPKPSDAVDGPVSARGRRIIRPTTDTRVALRVTRRLGEPTGADVDVQIPAPVEVAADLGEAAACNAGLLTLRTHTKSFGVGVTANVVGAPKRAIDVSRVDGAGHTVTAHLERGSTTTAFAKLPMDGDWVLASKLLAGESCEKPPHTLTIAVHTACEGAVP